MADRIFTFLASLTIGVFLWPASAFAELVSLECAYEDGYTRDIVIDTDQRSFQAKHCPSDTIGDLIWKKVHSITESEIHFSCRSSVLYSEFKLNRVSGVLLYSIHVSHVPGVGRKVTSEINGVPIVQTGRPTVMNCQKV